MNTDIINTILMGALFLALFGVAEILYYKFKVNVEITRKIVHIGTGLLTLLFPVLLGNHWLVLILCSAFAIILILSLKLGFLKSINAIERTSVGSIAYPLAVYSSYACYQYFDNSSEFFYLPVLLLAICDPVAAFVGNKWPLGKYKSGKSFKTIMGSFAFFCSALIICFTGLSLMTTNDFILLGIVIALSATLAEAFSAKGYDNITIPVAVLACLIINNNVG